MKPIILILLGAPGAGKGTVAQYMTENYDVRHFSTGNLLREEVKSRSVIGLEVEEILGSGGLVSDDLVNRLVSVNVDRVLSSASVVVLDGYPRTVEQAMFLETFDGGKLRSSIRVLEVVVPDEVVVARISHRRVCEKCGSTYADDVSVCSCGGRLVKRKDDEESVVRNRLSEYKKVTQPVTDFYGDDRRISVSGEGALEEVMQRVDEALMHWGIKKRR